MKSICYRVSAPHIHSPASPPCSAGAVLLGQARMGKGAWVRRDQPSGLQDGARPPGQEAWIWKPSLGLCGQQHLRGFEEVTSSWQGKGPGDPVAVKMPLGAREKLEAEESPDPAGSSCRHGLPGAALQQPSGVHGHGFHLSVSSAISSIKVSAGKSKESKNPTF